MEWLSGVSGLDGRGSDGVRAHIGGVVRTNLVRTSLNPVGLQCLQVVNEGSSCNICDIACI